MYNLSDVFREIASIPAPSGYEQSIRASLMRLVSSYVDEYNVDIQGNLICYRHGSCVSRHQTIMFVAHMDEIGMMVSYIEDSGYIRFAGIGGVDFMSYKGRNVKILHENTEVRGVIGARPVHMMRKGWDNKDFDDSCLWIDIGLTGKEDVEKLVSVGDCIILDSLFVEMPNSLISSRGCDNKAGVLTLLRMLELIKDIDCESDIVIVFSVQEETGLRGAKTASYSVAPDICISVDVVHATDYPTVNKSKYGDIRVGNGPVIPIGSDFTSSVQHDLKDLSEQMSIKTQSLAMSGVSGTDSGAVQVIRAGCATGLVGIPCRYMHAPIEIVSLKDIENASLVVAEFCKTKISENEY